MVPDFQEYEPPETNLLSLFQKGIPCGADEIAPPAKSPLKSLLSRGCDSEQQRKGRPKITNIMMHRIFHCCWDIGIDTDLGKRAMRSLSSFSLLSTT